MAADGTTEIRVTPADEVVLIFETQKEILNKKRKKT